MHRSTKIFLLRSTPGIFFLLMVGLLVRFGFAGSAHSETATAATPKPGYNLADVRDALKQPMPAPEFTGIDTWLNGERLTIAGLKGRVVLVDFWAYSCVNCVRTLPYLKAWDEKYRAQGLTIVGVHAPEFAFEKDAGNVAAALKKWGINYPVALDNALGTWKAFNNQYWPAHYLIDREGRVVYTHFGEGKYDITEQNIRVLLGLGAEKTTAATPDAAPAFTPGQTPETYLGYARADSYAGLRPVPINTRSDFVWPKAFARDQWGLNGRWTIGAQHLTAEDAGAALQLHFHARKVFAVLGTRDDKPHTLKLLLNGKPFATTAGADAKNGTVTVDRHRLYELLDLGKMGEGTLTLETETPGLEAYTFTFGS
ncbi:MAG: thioredoxin family protein [Rickettsiales bacterium]